MSFNDAEMNKVNVIDGIDHYVDLYIFTNPEARHQDSITVIVQKDRALLIDTAFPEYAVQVKDDLESRGIKPEIVILSHYHADHAAGCSVFPEAGIYACEFYEPNYINCRTWEPQYTFLRPTHTVRDRDRLVFGGFDLEFLHAPGHSRDTVITRIGPRVVHGADLIMITKDKKESLPFIADGGNFREHIRSLELLKTLDPEILLLSHGGKVDNKEDIHEMIENRIHYLERTLATMGTLPLPACLRGDISNYDHLEFHDTNLMRLLE